MVNKKINQSSIFIILIYLFVFQSLIQNVVPIFKYFDEFIASLSIIYFIFKLIIHPKITISKKNVKIFVCFFIIIFAGLYANYRYKYQKINYVFADVFVMFKFFLAYYLSKKVFKYKVIQEYKKKISFHISILIYFLFILTICNYIFTIFPSRYYRFGIMSNQLFYGHPTGLTATMVLLISIMFLCGKNIKSKEVLMSIIIILSTLRFKAFGGIAICIAIPVYVQIFNKKLTFGKLTCVGFVCIILAFQPIISYFGTEGSARGVLLNTSFEIANDYFPFGTGFATFASYFSVQNYSLVYKKYNIDTVFGLAEDNAMFVSDSFWPMLLGQFGYIGTLAYIIVLYSIYKQIQNSFSKKNRNIYVAKMICLGYLMISSIAESAFVSSIAVQLAIIIGISTDMKINDINEEENNER